MRLNGDIIPQQKMAYGSLAMLNYQDIKSTGLEMMGQIHVFLSGRIDKVGHCKAGYVFISVGL